VLFPSFPQASEHPGKIEAVKVKVRGIRVVRGQNSLSFMGHV
jgi:hypothetical protein